MAHFLTNGIVACPACGQKNRVNMEKVFMKIQCGKCHRRFDIKELAKVLAEMVVGR